MRDKPRKFVVFVGAGGHAAEMLGAAYSMVVMRTFAPAVVFAVETQAQADAAVERWRGKLGPAPPNVLLLSDLSALPPMFQWENCLGAALAIGDPYTRSRLWTAVLLPGIQGAPWRCVAHETSVNGGSALILEAHYFGAHSYLGPFVRLGTNVHLNRGAHVAHDCEIGDFTIIGPGAQILGAAKLGKRVQVGANAVVLPNVVVDDEAIVGAGAVVASNVLAGVTVVGNPARPLAQER